jgi:hypothetical protein
MTLFHAEPITNFLGYLEVFMEIVKRNNTDLEELGITFSTVLEYYAAGASAQAAFNQISSRPREEKVEFQIGVGIAQKENMKSLLRSLGVPIDTMLKKAPYFTEYLKLRITPEAFAKFIIGRNALGEQNWIKDLHARIIRV